MCSEKVTKIPPPFPPLFKDERLRDIGHSINIENLRFDVNSLTISYLIYYDGLSQNATAILLQNATKIYYKMRQVFYYKMRQLLQITTILLQNATVNSKCDVHYKLRQYSYH